MLGKRSVRLFQTYASDIGKYPCTETHVRFSSVALVDGKATAKGFMPLAVGPVTVSGATGADATTAAVAVSATSAAWSNAFVGMQPR